MAKINFFADFSATPLGLAQKGRCVPRAMVHRETYRFRPVGPDAVRVLQISRLEG